MKLSIMNGVMVGCVLLLGASTALGGFTNGDFESGGVGFSSDYTYVLSNSAAGEFTVGTTPSLWNPAYANPTGTGSMLIADGTTTAPGRVWIQSMAVTAGTQYDVSFDAAVLNTSGSNAVLGLWVKPNVFTSTQLASLDLTGKSPGTWNSSTSVASFTPTASGTVEFFIGDLNFATAGNAFAIDNITVVPEPSSLALLGIGSLVGLGVYTRRRRRNA